jgi:hypothetical protein
MVGSFKRPFDLVDKFELGLDIDAASLCGLEQVFRAGAVLLGKLVDAHDRGVQRDGHAGMRGLFLLQRVADTEAVGRHDAQLGFELGIGAAQCLAQRKFPVAP